MNKEPGFLHFRTLYLGDPGFRVVVLNALALCQLTFEFMHWRSKWQPTPVFLSGESQGWGSLVGCPSMRHPVSQAQFLPSSSPPDGARAVGQ